MKFKIKVKSPKAGLSRLKKMIYGSPRPINPFPINCNLCNCCRCDEDILTDCCPDTFIPPVLCATISNKTNTCTCMPDHFEMVYSPTNDRWEGVVNSCGTTKIFRLFCNTAPTFELTATSEGCSTITITNTEYECNPFVFCAHVQEAINCCDILPESIYFAIGPWDGDCAAYITEGVMLYVGDCTWIYSDDNCNAVMTKDLIGFYFELTCNGNTLAYGGSFSTDCCQETYSINYISGTCTGGTPPASMAFIPTCSGNTYCCSGEYDITIAYKCDVLSNACCGCSKELPTVFNFAFVTNCGTIGTITTTIVYTTSASCPIVTQTAPSAVGWEGTIDLADYDNNHGAAIYFELYCDNGVWKMYYAMQSGPGSAAGALVAGGISGESTCFKFSYDVDGNPAATLVPMWNGTEYVCLGLQGGFTVDYAACCHCCPSVPDILWIITDSVTGGVVIIEKTGDNWVGSAFIEPCSVSATFTFSCNPECGEGCNGWQLAIDLPGLTPMCALGDPACSCDPFSISFNGTLGDPCDMGSPMTISAEVVIPF